MMQHQIDVLATVEKASTSTRFGWALQKFETLPSTNTYAKENCTSFTGPTLIVTKHQTEGRGRGSNTWEDSPGSFLSTWSIRLKKAKPDPRWSMGIGLYLYEALSDCFDQNLFSLKEPNDIYVGQRKLGGLLIEATSQGDRHDLHVGLGLNVSSIPTEHQESATHLQHVVANRHYTPQNFHRFLLSFGACLLHLENRASDTDAWLKKITPRLVAALNRCELHKDNPVRSIKADGTLQLDQGAIPWQSL